MYTDIIIRKRPTRICTFLSVCALGLYTTACDNRELPGEEKDPEKTELRFTASISDSPSTKAVHGSDIIGETTFPVGTNTFGMFITREDGTPLGTGSEDNMKLILTKSSGTGVDIWSQTDKNGTSLSLTAKLGENIRLTGYYPWTAGATATAVPFDLSGDMANCKDLLYLSSPVAETPTQVLDATPIALKFSHAYCWVTINLSKLTDKSDVKVKSISIENSYSGLKRIVNKGMIHPKTGEVVSGEEGPLAINCNVDLQQETPSEFNFLVPSFMGEDVQDSDILIRITTQGTGGSDEILSFPLNKTHLNKTDDDKYGLEKGKHNTYNIVYNNSEMVLSLSNWQETWIEDSKIGAGTGGSAKTAEWTISHTGTIGTPLEAERYILHTYLGEVAEGNNGAYTTITPATPGTGSTLQGVWGSFASNVPLCKKLLVASKEAMGGAAVPWKDAETGVLVAKQACADFREGGYTDWRLPRVSEFAMLSYGNNQVNLTPKEYWSGTEYSGTECYSVYYKVVAPTVLVNWFPQVISKTASSYVRCVRDFDKPKPAL